VQWRKFNFKLYCDRRSVGQFVLVGAHDQILISLFDNYFLSSRCRAPSVLVGVTRVNFSVRCLQWFCHSTPCGLCSWEIYVNCTALALKVIRMERMDNALKLPVSMEHTNDWKWILNVLVVAHGGPSLHAYLEAWSIVLMYMLLIMKNTSSVFYEFTCMRCVEWDMKYNVDESIVGQQSPVKTEVISIYEHYESRACVPLIDVWCETLPMPPKFASVCSSHFLPLIVKSGMLSANPHASATFI
jgi:hypothetical protein